MVKSDFQILTLFFIRSNVLKIPKMKKILLIILVVALGSASKAQDIFSIGPKIGVSSNTLTNNFDSIHSNTKNSFQIGAFIRIGSRIYFQPEANYQIATSTLNKSSSSSVQNQDISVTSLKVPALIGIKLIRKGPFNLRIMGGPAYTFILNKELTPPYMDGLWPIQSVDDIKNSIWSIQMGAGIDVLFITLDVRYELGMENIYNGESNFELKNNMFNVSLGIKFL